jgi:hypothetical protein
MLLVRVATEKALSFGVRSPNATSVRAMRAADRGQAPASAYRDHLLAGEWSHYRDCHIEPDWVLIFTWSERGCIQICSEVAPACTPCNQRATMP